MKKFEDLLCGFAEVAARSTEAQMMKFGASDAFKPESQPRSLRSINERMNDFDVEVSVGQTDSGSLATETNSEI